MNVLNPPVFDHIIFEDGLSYVPFEDEYTLTPFATGTGVGFVNSVQTALRNYSLCRNLTAYVDTVGSGDYIPSGHVFILDATHQAIMQVQFLATGNFAVQYAKLVMSSTITPSALNIKIAGFAPQP